MLTVATCRLQREAAGYASSVEKNIDIQNAVNETMDVDENIDVDENSKNIIEKNTDVFNGEILYF